MIARLALLALTGCYSFSTMGRAHVVERGKTEVWAAPLALIVATPGADGQEGGGSVRPMVDAGVRYGATDRIELGARLSTFGIGAGPRIQLLRSQKVDLLVAPAFVFTMKDKPAVELPVVGGWNFGRHQLVASARVAYQQHWGVGGVSGPLHFVYAGGSLGFAWQVTDHFALMPELALLTELWAQPGFASALSNGVGIQAGVGILWDE